MFKFIRIELIGVESVINKNQSENSIYLLDLLLIELEFKFSFFLSFLIVFSNDTTVFSNDIILYYIPFKVVFRSKLSSYIFLKNG